MLIYVEENEETYRHRLRETERDQCRPDNHHHSSMIIANLKLPGSKSKRGKDEAETRPREGTGDFLAVHHHITRVLLSRATPMPFDAFQCSHRLLWDQLNRHFIGFDWCLTLPLILIYFNLFEPIDEKCFSLGVRSAVHRPSLYNIVILCKKFISIYV